VNGVLPVALLGLAGVLVGGAWSLRRQGAPVGSTVVLGLLAALAAAAGVLRLIFGGS
jgi:hypothetical protein